METYLSYRTDNKKILIDLGFKMIGIYPHLYFTVADWVQEGEIVLFQECYKKDVKSKGLIRTIIYRRLIDVARKKLGRNNIKSSVKDNRWLGVEDCYGQEDKQFNKIEKRHILYSMCPTPDMREKMRLRLQGRTLKEIGKYFQISEGLVSRQFTSLAH